MRVRVTFSTATMLVMLAAWPAAAQTKDYASASPPANPTDAGETPSRAPLSPDESALLGQALLFDPSSLATSAPSKPLRRPTLFDKEGLDISHSEKPDGSSSMALKQPLPTEWDSKVGADLGLGPAAPVDYQPGKPLPGTGDRNSGAAWASLGVTNFATIDARVDPRSDQGKLGTTLKHSFPVGSQYSLTLQNSYALTEAYGQPPPGPADIPLMTLPPASGTPTPSQIWSTEQAVKFNLASTGTTFGAGLAQTSVDPVTHNKFSAEQKLYGGLNVTTAVTDVGQQSSNKSITAGFKLKW